MCSCGCNSCGETQSLLFDNADTLGFDWGSITGPAIHAGVQTGLSWLGNLFGGGGPSGANCLQGQVSGDEAMTNCVPRVLALFDEVESYIGLVPPEAIIQQANAIAGIFSDPQYFDQSIGGRSREIREAAKILGRQRADAIIAAVGGTVPVTGNVPAPGGPAPTPAPAANNAIAIDTQTVLLAGGGLVLLLLLLKS